MERRLWMALGERLVRFAFNKQLAADLSED
jgi:hypothetical protein